MTTKLDIETWEGICDSYELFSENGYHIRKFIYDSLFSHNNSYETILKIISDMKNNGQKIEKLISNKITNIVDIEDKIFNFFEKLFGDPGITEYHICDFFKKLGFLDYVLSDFNEIEDIDTHYFCLKLKYSNIIIRETVYCNADIILIDDYTQNAKLLSSKVYEK